MSDIIINFDTNYWYQYIKAGNILNTGYANDFVKITKIDGAELQYDFVDVTIASKNKDTNQYDKATIKRVKNNDNEGLSNKELYDVYYNFFKLTQELKKEQFVRLLKQSETSTTRIEQFAELAKQPDGFYGKLITDDKDQEAFENLLWFVNDDQVFKTGKNIEDFAQIGVKGEFFRKILQDIQDSGAKTAKGVSKKLKLYKTLETQLKKQLDKTYPTSGTVELSEVDVAFKNIPSNELPGAFRKLKDFIGENKPSAEFLKKICERLKNDVNVINASSLGTALELYKTLETQLKTQLDAIYQPAGMVKPSEVDMAFNKIPSDKLLDAFGKLKDFIGENKPSAEFLKKICEQIKDDGTVKNASSLGTALGTYETLKTQLDDTYKPSGTVKLSEVDIAFKNIKPENLKEAVEELTKCLKQSKLSEEVFKKVCEQLKDAKNIGEFTNITQTYIDLYNETKHPGIAPDQINAALEGLATAVDDSGNPAVSAKEFEDSAKKLKELVEMKIYANDFVTISTELGEQKTAADFNREANKHRNNYPEIQAFITEIKVSSSEAEEVFKNLISAFDNKKKYLVANSIQDLSKKGAKGKVFSKILESIKEAKLTNTSAFSRKLQSYKDLYDKAESIGITADQINTTLEGLATAIPAVSNADFEKSAESLKKLVETGISKEVFEKIYEQLKTATNKKQFEEITNKYIDLYDENNHPGITPDQINAALKGLATAVDPVSGNPAVDYNKFEESVGKLNDLVESGISADIFTSVSAELGKQEDADKFDDLVDNYKRDYEVLNKYAGTLNKITANDPDASIKKIIELVGKTVDNYNGKNSDALKAAKEAAIANGADATTVNNPAITNVVEINNIIGGTNNFTADALKAAIQKAKDIATNDAVDIDLSNVNSLDTLKIAINSSDIKDKKTAEDEAKTAAIDAAKDATKAAYDNSLAQQILSTYANICDNVPDFKPSSITTALKGISDKKPDELEKATKNLEELAETGISKEVFEKVCEELQKKEEFGEFEKITKIYIEFYKEAKGKGIKPDQINAALKGLATAVDPVSGNPAVDYNKFEESAKKLNTLVQSGISAEIFTSVSAELGKQEDATKFDDLVDKYNNLYNTTTILGFDSSLINTALKGIAKNKPDDLKEAAMELQKFTEVVGGEEVFAEICKQLGNTNKIDDFKGIFEPYNELCDTISSKPELLNFDLSLINKALKGIATDKPDDIKKATKKLQQFVLGYKPTTEVLEAVCKRVGIFTNVTDFGRELEEYEGYYTKAKTIDNNMGVGRENAANAYNNMIENGATSAALARIFDNNDKICNNNNEKKLEKLEKYLGYYQAANNSGVPDAVDGLNDIFALAEHEQITDLERNLEYLSNSTKVPPEIFGKILVDISKNPKDKIEILNNYVKLYKDVISTDRTANNGSNDAENAFKDAINNGITYKALQNAFNSANEVAKISETTNKQQQAKVVQTKLAEYSGYYKIVYNSGVPGAVNGLNDIFASVKEGQIEGLEKNLKYLSESTKAHPEIFGKILVDISKNPEDKIEILNNYVKLYEGVISTDQTANNGSNAAKDAFEEAINSGITYKALQNAFESANKVAAKCKLISKSKAKIVQEKLEKYSGYYKAADGSGVPGAVEGLNDIFTSANYKQIEDLEKNLEYLSDSTKVPSETFGKILVDISNNPKDKITILNDYRYYYEYANNIDYKNENTNVKDDLCSMINNGASIKIIEKMFVNAEKSGCISINTDGKKEFNEEQANSFEEIFNKYKKCYEAVYDEDNPNSVDILNTLFDNVEGENILDLAEFILNFSNENNLEGKDLSKILEGARGKKVFAEITESFTNSNYNLLNIAAKKADVDKELINNVLDKVDNAEEAAVHIRKLIETVADKETIEKILKSFENLKKADEVGEEVKLYTGLYKEAGEVEPKYINGALKKFDNVKEAVGCIEELIKTGAGKNTLKKMLESIGGLETEDEAKDEARLYTGLYKEAGGHNIEKQYIDGALENVDNIKKASNYINEFIKSGEKEEVLTMMLKKVKGKEKAEDIKTAFDSYKNLCEAIDNNKDFSDEDRENIKESINGLFERLEEGVDIVKAIESCTKCITDTKAKGAVLVKLFDNIEESITKETGLFIELYESVEKKGINKDVINNSLEYADDDNFKKTVGNLKEILDGGLKDEYIKKLFNNILKDEDPKVQGETLKDLADAVASRTDVKKIEKLISAVDEKGNSKTIKQSFACLINGLSDDKMADELIEDISKGESSEIKKRLQGNRDIKKSAKSINVLLRCGIGIDDATQIEKEDLNFLNELEGEKSGKGRDIKEILTQLGMSEDDKEQIYKQLKKVDFISALRSLQSMITAYNAEIDDSKAQVPGLNASDIIKNKDKFNCFIKNNKDFIQQTYLNATNQQENSDTESFIEQVKSHADQLSGKYKKDLIKRADKLEKREKIFNQDVSRLNSFINMNYDRATYAADFLDQLDRINKSLGQQGLSDIQRNKLEVEKKNLLNQQHNFSHDNKSYRGSVAGKITASILAVIGAGVAVAAFTGVFAIATAASVVVGLLGAGLLTGSFGFLGYNAFSLAAKEAKLRGMAQATLEKSNNALSVTIGQKVLRRNDKIKDKEYCDVQDVKDGLKLATLKNIENIKKQSITSRKLADLSNASRDWKTAWIIKRGTVKIKKDMEALSAITDDYLKDTGELRKGLLENLGELGINSTGTEVEKSEEEKRDLLIGRAFNNSKKRGTSR